MLQAALAMRRVLSPFKVVADLLHESLVLSVTRREKSLFGLLAFHEIGKVLLDDRLDVLAGFARAAEIGHLGCLICFEFLLRRLQVSHLVHSR